MSDQQKREPLPGRTRIRVISGNACFYTTVAAIRNGIGDFVDFNRSVHFALDVLERDRAIGVSGTWWGIDVQLNVA